MAGEKISGVAVASVSAGALLLYAGITGKDIPRAVQAVISGKSPATAPKKHPITGTTTGITAGGSAGGQQIAAAALAYQGHCYSFGGAPGPDGQGCWDCSSFVNWVIGHDLGQAIPGYKPGTYDGTSHGPTTLLWLAWTGVNRIPQSQAAAGDIFCWQTHMGIATGPDSMISAQTPASGTQIATGNIGSFMPSEILFVLRLKQNGPVLNA